MFALLSLTHLELPSNNKIERRCELLVWVSLWICGFFSHTKSISHTLCKEFNNNEFDFFFKYEFDLMHVFVQFEYDEYEESMAGFALFY